MLGLDNAVLALPVAGVGSRMLAAFLDGLFQVVIQIVWLIVCFSGSSAPGGWRFVVYAAGAFLVDWVYFAGSEIAMGGRTLGKRIVGLRVVTASGGSASAGSLLTRNLLRPVDLFVGVLLMILDPLSRRLGDRLAGTIVVHDRSAPDEPLLRRIPKGWQAHDVALIEALLRRADDLEAPRAEAMAERIVQRLAREEPAFLEGALGTDGSLRTLRRAFGIEPS